MEVSQNSSSKVEDVSQNFCVFDVVNCQFKKLRKSRRIASLTNLQIDRLDRYIDRPHTDRQIGR